VNPAKTAEAIEMPFRLRTRIGPKKHVSDRGSDFHTRRDNFEGEGAAQSVGMSDVSRAKTAEPIEISFGVWTRDGPIGNMY